MLIDSHQESGPLLNRILYFSLAALVLAIGYSGIEFYWFSSARHRAAQDEAVETTAALKTQISSLIERVDREAAQLAKQFGENDYSDEEVRELIRECAARIPESQGVTAAYEPFAFKDDTRLFAPYYDKTAKKFIEVGDSYDYSDASSPNTKWYTNVRDNGPRWIEPYFGTASEFWYVDRGVPFHYSSGDRKGEVRGTITISFLCRDFGRLIRTMSLGKTGYGFLTSEEGTFLAHPNASFVGRKNIEDWIASTNQPDAFKLACESMQQGGEGSVTFQDASTGDTTLLCYDHLSVAGWGIGMAFLPDDLMGDQDGARRRTINLTLLGSLFLVCVLAIAYNFDYLDASEIWRLSLLSTMLLLGNVVFIGMLEHRTRRYVPANTTDPITSFAALDTFVDRQHAFAEEARISPAVAVPTGINIRRMDFQDSYNLNVGGTIWQKIPPEIAESDQPGFAFPQASPFAESLMIEEVWRKEVAGKEGEQSYRLVGWDFRVTLQLNFQYGRFPFDKRLIDIRLAPRDQSGDVMLVPDLASYRSTNPSSRPGLGDTIALSGNEITETWFDFSVESLATDFGFGPTFRGDRVPVLHYNVQLRRKLLNVFVTYLIPIVVAMLMIFILLCACRKTSERQGIIESMAAFLFVLIFSHIDLRKEVVTGELIYLEYFYFVTYAMVLLSTFNLMAFTLDKTKVFDFENNLIFKAIYFPLFLLIVLVVTLAKFY